jgi:hypothetical protein
MPHARPCPRALFAGKKHLTHAVRRADMGIACFAMQASIDKQ